MSERVERGVSEEGAGGTCEGSCACMVWYVMVWYGMYGNIISTILLYGMYCTGVCLSGSLLLNCPTVSNINREWILFILIQYIDL